MNGEYKVYGENSSNIEAIYYKLIEFYLDQAELNFMRRNKVNNYIKKFKVATSEDIINKTSSDLLTFIYKNSYKINSSKKINLNEKIIESIISSVRIRDKSAVVERIYNNLKNKDSSSAIEYMVRQISIIKENELKHLQNTEKKNERENDKNERLSEENSQKTNEYNSGKITKSQIPKEQTVSTRASDVFDKTQNSIAYIFEQIVNKYLNSDIKIFQLYDDLKKDFYAHDIRDEKCIKACFIKIVSQKFSKINRVFEKNKPDIGDLHRLAMTIYETLPEELMHNGIHNTTIINGLVTYEKAYQEYVKYYEKLSKEEKQNQEFFARPFYPDPYQAILGKKVEDFYIITPEDLRKAVNKKVSKEMKEIHYFSHLYNEVSTLNKIVFPTQFMTIEEIAGIYSGIRRVNEETRVYSEEKLKICQSNFALAILARENKDLSKLTQTEIAEEIKIICEKYFKEESLTKVLPEKQSNKIKTEEKFYKLSKLNKTFEEISKEYPRFIELMQNDELTNKQQEELENMFKGPRR